MTPILVEGVADASSPSPVIAARYLREGKTPLPIGVIDDGCELGEGNFWSGAMARHDRHRLTYAIWGALSRCILGGLEGAFALEQRGQR